MVSAPEPCAVMLVVIWPATGHCIRTPVQKADPVNVRPLAAVSTREPGTGMAMDAAAAKGSPAPVTVTLPLPTNEY